jgi:hypothetical protein
MVIAETFVIKATFMGFLIVKSTPPSTFFRLPMEYIFFHERGDIANALGFRCPADGNKSWLGCSIQH